MFTELWAGTAETGVPGPTLPAMNREEPQINNGDQPPIHHQ